MIAKYLWTLRQILKGIWFRVSSFAVVAIFLPVLAPLFSPWVPDDLSFKLGDNTVAAVLQIIASSMLTVTTFSLSIAVQAYSTAASTATPRATALLQQDTTTQNVLATFLGTFLFSLIGIIGLELGIFDTKGRTILFFATLGVVLIIVVALLRWISHLITFGMMSDTLDRAEAAARASLQSRSGRPSLDAAPLEGAIPPNTHGIRAGTSGYVRHMDVHGLQDLATKHDVTLWCDVEPGDFVYSGQTILYVEGARPDSDLERALRAGVTIGPERNYDQDPRFGLVVLSEIGSRALSPAVNDPGTAIDVLVRLVRVLEHWTPVRPEAPMCPRVRMRPLGAEQMLDDAFHAIARDGAGNIEVQHRLHNALRALVIHHKDIFGAAALDASCEAFDRCKALPMQEFDCARVEKVRLTRAECCPSGAMVS